jgi:quinone-modifying oxidoreductase subunit QmoA
MQYVLDQSETARVTFFYIDRRTPGRLEDILRKLEEDERVTLVKGKVAEITEDPATGKVTLVAEDTLNGKKVRAEADLAVLAVGLEPESKDAGFPADWKTDEFGFLPAASPITGGGVAPGVFAAGTAKRPGEVSGAVKDATGSVLRAITTARQA